MMENRINSARSKGGIVNELLYTEFCDKRDILKKLLFAEDSRRGRFVRFLKEIEELRNHLAHSNDYADTNPKARNVCSVARNIIELRKFLRHADAT
jgi:hypothetical protein